MKKAKSILVFTILLTLAFVQPSFASQQNSNETSRETQSSTSSGERVLLQYYPPPRHY